MSTTGVTARRATGFTMIEILVTLVILMVGLLGIAGLMAQGQRASFEAYQRQQALALASDMAERIKANPAGVGGPAGGTYLDALASPVGSGTTFTAMATDCAATTCTSADVVQYDVAMWDGLISGVAAETSTSGGGPILNPLGCVQLIGAGVCAACGATVTSRQVRYRVSVAWQGTFATSPPPPPPAPLPPETCGQDQYRNPATGTVSEAFRRVVSVEVNTVLQCACP